MARGWLVGAILGLALGLASVAGAQPDTAPQVEVENVTIEGLIDPLDEPGETQVEIRVGCEAGEIVGTETVAELQTVDLPEWANTIVSPTTLSWQTQPGDCPSTDLPFRRNVSVSVALTQNADAYESTEGRIVANVNKTTPEGPSRTYGPHAGSLTFMPGYFHQHNDRMDVKVLEVAPNETAVFEGTIENFSNHETRFTLEPQPLSEATPARVETSDPLVLGPDETGTYEIRVVPTGDVGASGATVTAQVHILGESTHPAGGEDGTSQVSVLAKFQGATSGADPRDAPGPGAAVVVTVLGALALRTRS